ncbi:microfibril-associated glycoprotein 4-like [Saccostrea cucullata]|uniref:microfibril-associated glycoprotein 4-like n=1 Tax=Saccostrea cuccullata TaxID=36930 RepID=UPI002ED59ECE
MYHFLNSDFKRNLDCQELYINGEIQSGVYTIYPFGTKRLVNVFCNMESQGGGWTAIQRRLSGSVAFSRTWAEYKQSFGNPAGSYWIGDRMLDTGESTTNLSGMNFSTPDRDNDKASIGGCAVYAGGGGGWWYNV